MSFQKKVRTGSIVFFFVMLFLYLSLSRSEVTGFISGYVTCPLDGTIHIAAFSDVDSTGMMSGKQIGGTFIPHEGPYIIRHMQCDKPVFLFAVLDADESDDISDGDYMGKVSLSPVTRNSGGWEHADITMKPIGVSHGERISSSEEIGRGEESLPGKIDSLCCIPARLHYQGLRNWEVGEGLSLPGSDPLRPFREFGYYLASVPPALLLIALFVYLLGMKGESFKGDGNVFSSNGKNEGIVGDDRDSYSGLVLIFAVIIGGVLRIPGLGTESLDHLEATYLLGGQGAPSLFWSLFSRVGLDQGHQPLYHAVLYLWTRVAGDSLAAGRLLSAFFGIATIPMVFLLGKIIADSRAASIAVLLFAFAPLHVWYSRDLTPYTMMAFLSVTNYYFLILSGKSGKGRHIAIYVISGILLFYTHYFGVGIITAGFIHAGLNLAGSKKDSVERRKWIRVIAGGLVIIAAISAWVPEFVETNRVQHYLHSCERMIKRPFTPFEWREDICFFFGCDPSKKYLLLLLVPVGGAAFFNLSRKRPALLSAVIPPLGICAVMNFVYWAMTHLQNKGLASFEIRHSLDMLPYLSIALAATFADVNEPNTMNRLTRIVSGIALLGIFALNSSWMADLLNAPVKADLKGAFRYVAENIEDGDAVVIMPIFFYSQAGNYYFLQKEKSDFAGLMKAPRWHRVAEVSGSNEKSGSFFGLISDFDLPYDDVLKSLFFKRIWIVDVDDHLFGSEIFWHWSSESVLSRLRKQVELISEVGFRNVEVYLFQGHVSPSVKAIGNSAGNRYGCWKMNPGLNDFGFVKDMWPSPVFPFRGRYITHGSKTAVPRDLFLQDADKWKIIISGRSGSTGYEKVDVTVSWTADPPSSAFFPSGKDTTIILTVPSPDENKENPGEGRDNQLIVSFEPEDGFNKDAGLPTGPLLKRFEVHPITNYAGGGGGMFENLMKTAEMKKK